MISDGQWSSLLLLRRTDFRYPDNLEWSVVKALDDFSSLIGRRPVILSDYRPFDPADPNSQHALGRAIDVAFPGADSLALLSQLQAARLFSGYGLYNNEANAQSFHVDTRVNRTVDNPATWGAIVSHPGGKQVNDYVGLSYIVDLVKKNSVKVLGLVLLVLGLIWVSNRRARSVRFRSSRPTDR